MLRGLAVGACFLLAVTGHAPAADGVAPPPARPKLLVEFGWDEPDTAFLRRHVETMARLPLDGCVFHASARQPGGEIVSLCWKFWGHRTFTEAELAAAFEDLKALKPGRFRHNFLRVNTTPGDLDWFEDFAPVLANARIAARLAKAGNCRGVLFDVEQYETPLFDYRKQKRRAGKSWEEYAAQAKRRGREFVAALQEAFPDLTVLLTFGASLVDRETRQGQTPPRETENGLLAPFLAGMAEGRKGATRLVDGYELSYGYRTADEFDRARERIQASSPRLEVGFGLWMDFGLKKHGWDVADPTRNYFTPEAFEASLRAALERTDEIVWVYTEKPLWWTPPDGASKRLPPAYVEAVRRARKGFTAD